MKAGFIGLGNIGRPMAVRLVRPGFAVTVFDVMPDGPKELSALGATVAPTPKAVAERSDVLGICVRDDKQVSEVIEGPGGILEADRPGLVIAIHSTIRPATVHRLHAAAAKRGMRVIDAPISGGAPGAAAGTLVYMVGGDPADIERARPQMETSAGKIILAGGLGAGAALKICNNLMTYLGLVAVDEGHRLAAASGLDPALLGEVTAANGVANPQMAGFAKGRVAGWADKSGPIYKSFESLTGIAEKDLDCALEASKEGGVELPVTAAVRQAIRRAYLGS